MAKIFMRSAVMGAMLLVIASFFASYTFAQFFDAEETEDVDTSYTESGLGDEEVVQPDEDVAQPDEEVAQPDEEVAQPDEEVVQPDEEVVQPDEEVAQPDEDVAQPDEEVAQPDEEVAQPDEEVAQPDEEVAQPAMFSTDENHGSAVISQEQNSKTTFEDHKSLVQNATLEGIQLSVDDASNPDEMIITGYFIFRDKPTSYFFESDPKKKTITFEFTDTKIGVAPISSATQEPIKGFNITNDKVDVNAEVVGLTPEWHDVLKVKFNFTAVPKINVKDEYTVISFSFPWPRDPSHVNKFYTEDPGGVNKALLATLIVGGVGGLGALGVYMFLLEGEEPPEPTEEDISISDIPDHPENP